CRRSSGRSSDRSGRRRSRRRREPAAPCPRRQRGGPRTRPPRLFRPRASGRKIARSEPRVTIPMPELPEVETVRRGLALKMTGRRIARAELRRPDLRRPFPPMLAERLDGALIGELARRGKYILIELDETGLLLLHLGMRSEEHTSEL